MRNKAAILTGLFLQFVILPFLGFCVVKGLELPPPLGITLLVLTSSPGGSYSNWWCSMFNADLALSVTMTAISTLLSVVMLPCNLVLYITNIYSDEEVHFFNWLSLFLSLLVVLTAVGAGLLCSAKMNTTKFNLLMSKFGNLVGVILVSFSILIVSQVATGFGDSSGGGNDAHGGGDAINSTITNTTDISNETTTQYYKLWDGRDWRFFFGVATPCIVGLILSIFFASYFEIKKPERVTVTIECCFQNIGIATAVAIAMFDDADLADAIGVPLYYMLVQAAVLGLYCIIAWKIGWTKAPVDEALCVTIGTSYEIEEAEVLKSSPSGDQGGGSDMNTEVSPRSAPEMFSDDHGSLSVETLEGHSHKKSKKQQELKSVSTIFTENRDEEGGMIDIIDEETLEIIRMRQSHHRRTIDDDSTCNNKEKEVTLDASQSSHSFSLPWKKKNKAKSSVPSPEAFEHHHKRHDDNHSASRTQEDSIAADDMISIAGESDLDSGLSVDDFTDNMSISGFSAAERKERQGEAVIFVSEDTPVTVTSDTTGTPSPNPAEKTIGEEHVLVRSPDLTATALNTSDSGSIVTPQQTSQRSTSNEGNATVAPSNSSSPAETNIPHSVSIEGSLHTANLDGDVVDDEKAETKAGSS